MATSLRQPSIFVSLVIAAFLLSSCGSSEPVDAGSADPDEVTLSGPRPESVSEQDIATARAAFNSAKADWEDSGITDYRLEVGVETIGLVHVEVVGGEAASEKVVQEGADNWFNDPVPRTVDGLFDELDEMISLFEDDPAKVLPPDDCGYALNARFDPDLGYPSYYDTLGPCDDGVGLSAKVVPQES